MKHNLMPYSKLPTDAAVIYSGPSLIDGKPIVVIAVTTTSNSKTGAVVQTYIMRADIYPRDASKTGEDYSICGNCPLRGTPTDNPKLKVSAARGCYVVIGHGVLIVYKSYKRGTVYPTISGHTDIAALGAGKVVRLGTYGDPSAVPGYIWDSLVSRCARHMGYTHQNTIASADVRPDLCMTSADSLADAQAAWARGERTYRIVENYGQLQLGKEIACPADTKGIQCATCRLCGGTSVAAKSIAIVKHGIGSKYVNAAV